MPSKNNGPHSSLVMNALDQLDSDPAYTFLSQVILTSVHNSISSLGLDLGKCVLTHLHLWSDSPSPP